MKCFLPTMKHNLLRTNYGDKVAFDVINSFDDKAGYTYHELTERIEYMLRYDITDMDKLKRQAPLYGVSSIIDGKNGFSEKLMERVRSIVGINTNGGINDTYLRDLVISVVSEYIRELFGHNAMLIYVDDEAKEEFLKSRLSNMPVKKLPEVAPELTNDEMNNVYIVIPEDYIKLEAKEGDTVSQNIEGELALKPGSAIEYDVSAIDTVYILGGNVRVIRFNDVELLSSIYERVKDVIGRRRVAGTIMLKNISEDVGNYIIDASMKDDLVYDIASIVMFSTEGYHGLMEMSKVGRKINPVNNLFTSDITQQSNAYDMIKYLLDNNLFANDNQKALLRLLLKVIDGNPVLKTQMQNIIAYRSFVPHGDRVLVSIISEFDSLSDSLFRIVLYDPPVHRVEGNVVIDEDGVNKIINAVIGLVFSEISDYIVRNNIDHTTVSSKLREKIINNLKGIKYFLEDEIYTRDNATKRKYEEIIKNNIDPLIENIDFFITPDSIHTLLSAQAAIINMIAIDFPDIRKKKEMYDAIKDGMLGYINLYASNVESKLRDEMGNVLDIMEFKKLTEGFIDNVSVYSSAFLTLREASLVAKKLKNVMRDVIMEGRKFDPDSDITNLSFLYEARNRALRNSLSFNLHKHSELQRIAVSRMFTTIVYGSNISGINKKWADGVNRILRHNNMLPSGVMQFYPPTINNDADGEYYDIAFNAVEGNGIINDKFSGRVRIYRNGTIILNKELMSELRNMSIEEIYSFFVYLSRFAYYYGLFPDITDTDLLKGEKTASAVALLIANGYAHLIDSRIRLSPESENTLEEILFDIAQTNNVAGMIENGEVNEIIRKIDNYVKKRNREVSEHKWWRLVNDKRGAFGHGLKTLAPGGPHDTMIVTDEYFPSMMFINLFKEIVYTNNVGMEQSVFRMLEYISPQIMNEIVFILYHMYVTNKIPQMSWDGLLDFLMKRYPNEIGPVYRYFTRFFGRGVMSVARMREMMNEMMTAIEEVVTSFESTILPEFERLNNIRVNRVYSYEKLGEYIERNNTREGMMSSMFFDLTKKLDLKVRIRTDFSSMFSPTDSGVTSIHFNPDGVIDIFVSFSRMMQSDRPFKLTARDVATIASTYIIGKYGNTRNFLAWMAKNASDRETIAAFKLLYDIETFIMRQAAREHERYENMARMGLLDLMRSGEITGMTREDVSEMRLPELSDRELLEKYIDNVYNVSDLKAEDVKRIVPKELLSKSYVDKMFINKMRYLSLFYDIADVVAKLKQEIVNSVVGEENEELVNKILGDENMLLSIASYIKKAFVGIENNYPKEKHKRDVERRIIKNNPAVAVNTKAQDSVTRDVLYDIVLTYQSLMPNIRFIQETNETAGEDRIAWIDRDGLHFNIDRVDARSFAHEMAELFLVFLKNDDPETYNIIINTVADKIDTDSTVKALADTISDKYGIVGEALLVEVASHLLEADTLHAVAMFLIKNGRIDDAKLLFNSSTVPDLIKSLSETTPFFGKYVTDYIVELLVNNKFNDKLLVNLINPRYKLSIRNPFVNKSLRAVKEVDNILDMAHWWNNKVADGVLWFVQDPDKEANDYYLRHFANKDVFRIPNTDIVIDKKTSSHEYIINIIKEKVIIPRREFEASLPDEIIKVSEIFRKFRLVDDKRKALEKIIEKTNISYSEFARLMTLMNVEEGSVVMRYSDLKYSEKYSHLYDPSFDTSSAFEMIVVINDYGNGSKPEVSLFVVTTRSLTGMADYDYVRNDGLAQSMTKNEYKSKRGTWKNNREGMVNAIVAMTVQAMMHKSGGNMVFGNGGIVSFDYSGKLSASTFVDINKMIDNLNILREEMRNNRGAINNRTLLAIIDDDKLYDPETYSQDWIKRLGNYLIQKYSYYANVLNKAFGVEAVSMGRQLLSDMRPYLMKEMILRRIAQLKKFNRLSPDQEKELYFLTRALMQLDFGFSTFMNNIKDIGKTEKFMATLRTFGNDILQWIVMQGGISAMRWKSKFMDHLKEFKKYARQIKNDVPLISSIRMRSPFMEVAGEYFSNMYVVADAIIENDMVVEGKVYKKGDKVKVRLPKVYHTEEDVRAGRITKAQREFYLWFLGVANQLIIENALYDLRKTNPKATIDDALKMVQLLQEGDIFIVTKSMNERLFSGDFVGFYNRMMTEAGFEEHAIGNEIDEKDPSDKLARHIEVVNYYNHQIKDHNNIYSIAGIRRSVDSGGNITYHIDSPEALIANRRVSTDMQRMIFSFLKEMLRYREYDENIVPRINAAFGLMNFLQAADVNIKLDNVKDLLYLIDRRIFERRYVDTNENNIQTKYGNISIPKIIRIMLNSTSFVFLAYSLRIMLRSFTYNVFTDLFSAASKTIANIGIKSEEELAGYGLDDALKGSVRSVRMLTSDVRRKVIGMIEKKQNNGELLALCMMLGTVEASEAAMTGIFRKSFGRTRITKQDFGHFLNQLTDVGARMYATLSMMVEHGSIDAYTYDEATNTFTYNIKKDRRYYNEDGTQTEEQYQLVWGKNGLVERLVAEGKIVLKEGQTIESVKPEDIPTGYDSALIVNTLQYYIDKYVMASLGEWEKNMLNSTALGALFGQYRIFNFERVLNMGLFGYTRKTAFGGGFKPVKVDGQWVNAYRVSVLEGSAQSLARTADMLKHMFRGEFITWWNKQPEIRRINLVRTLLKSVIFGAFVYGMAAAASSERRKKLYKYLFLFSDMIMVTTAIEVIKSPFPLLVYLSNVVDVIVGNAKLENFLKKKTPARIVYEPVEFYDYIVNEYLDAENSNDMEIGRYVPASVSIRNERAVFKRQIREF